MPCTGIRTWSDCRHVYLSLFTEFMCGNAAAPVRYTITPTWDNGFGALEPLTNDFVSLKPILRKRKQEYPLGLQNGGA